MLFLAALAVVHLAPVSAAAPNRQPQLAASSGITAMVFGSGESIWFTRSPDQGRSWAPPAKVADLPRLMLGRHRGPRVAIAGSAILVSAVATESDLYCWRSTDGGKTWSKPVAVNDKAKSAREGLHAMAADDEGNVAAAWLDDRIPGGKRLWGAFSHDAGATWSKNVMLYESPSGTICECCHPSLAALGKGSFEVMWRNSLDGSRDFYVMRLEGGKPASQAVKAGTGTWKLNACPMDGGGIALRNGKVLTAWRREKDIFLAEGAERETRLGTGQDAALAANAKGAYVVWSTPGGILARTPASPQPRALSAAGAFPALVSLPGGGVLSAWEENGTIAVLPLE
jgi:hypothetical protein